MAQPVCQDRDVAAVSVLNQVSDQSQCTGVVIIYDECCMVSGYNIIDDDLGNFAMLKDLNFGKRIKRRKKDAFDAVLNKWLVKNFIADIRRQDQMVSLFAGLRQSTIQNGTEKRMTE